MSALQDSHVQELLLKETSNARAAAREKAKLAQMEIDGMTPLYPGCRPEDTHLNVTLKLRDEGGTQMERRELQR